MLGTGCISIYLSIHPSLSTCIYTLGMMQAGKTVHMSSTVEVFGCSLGWHYHYLPRWNLSYTFIYLNPWRMNSSSHSYGGVLNIGESRKPMRFNKMFGLEWFGGTPFLGNLLIWKTHAKKQLALHPISSARKITSASAWHAAFSPSNGSWSHGKIGMGQKPWNPRLHHSWDVHPQWWTMIHSHSMP